MVLQGRRNGGAEGANAPSIFGKLHQLSKIFGLQWEFQWENGQKSFFGNKIR